MGPAKPRPAPRAPAAGTPLVPPPGAPMSAGEYQRLAAEQAALKRELSRVYAEACGGKPRVPR